MRISYWSSDVCSSYRGRFASEIVAVAGSIVNVGEGHSCITDEQPRATSEAALAKLKSVTRPDGTVTAGNASGINDGAAAMIIATLDEAKCQGLTPRAKILGYAVAGVEPRFMGVGPIPAISRLLAARKYLVSGMSVSERVDPGGRRLITKTNKNK